MGPINSTRIFLPLVLFALAAGSVLATLPTARSTPQVVPAGPIYVGLIEDDRRQLTQLGDGHSVPGQKSIDDPVPGRTITAYFVKDGTGWNKVQQLNQGVRWTVAFDGKDLGRVESALIPTSESRPKNFPAVLCVHAILTPPTNVPAVGSAGGDFNGGWGFNVRRPLVVVSKPNFTDPEHWKRAKLPDDLVQSVRKVFHKTFPHIRQCDPSGEPLPADSRIPDSEIGVLKAYSSNKGSFIVETRLANHRCVFNMDGTELQLLEGDQWYHVTPVGEVVFLARDWKLVDAGDYDGDGKSEVIFYVAESEDDAEVETEGYILFYDDFQHSVRFTWNWMDQ